jgi:hypothetical protein
VCWCGWRGCAGALPDPLDDFINQGTVHFDPSSPLAVPALSSLAVPPSEYSICVDILRLRLRSSKYGDEFVIDHETLAFTREEQIFAEGA